MSDTKVGAGRSTSLAAWAAMASSGVTHRWSWISDPSTVTSNTAAAPLSGSRKNQVAKRRDRPGGVVQCAHGTSCEGSMTTPASSAASRTAALVAPVSWSSGLPSG